MKSPEPCTASSTRLRPIASVLVLGGHDDTSRPTCAHRIVSIEQVRKRRSVGVRWPGRGRPSCHNLLGSNHARSFIARGCDCSHVVGCPCGRWRQDRPACRYTGAGRLRTHSRLRLIWFVSRQRRSDAARCQRSLCARRSRCAAVRPHAPGYPTVDDRRATRVCSEHSRRSRVADRAIRRPIKARLDQVRRDGGVACH